MYINTNKDKMVEVAFSLSLKYGFDNVSIKQIQEEANVSAGALYYYFKDKNDLLAYMIDRFIKDQIKKYGENIRNFKGTASEKLKFILYRHAGQEFRDENFAIKLSNDDVMDSSKYDLFVLGVYHQHPEFRPLLHDLYKEMLKIYEDFVENLKEKNEIRSDIDTKETALYIFTVLAGFVKLWISFPNIPFEKIADINLKMLCDTLGCKDLQID